MEASAVSVTQVIVQIVSPVVFAALVTYMMRDLKGDLREFRQEIIEKVERLSEDHTKFSERLARMEGLFEGFAGRQADSTWEKGS